MSCSSGERYCGAVRACENVPAMRTLWLAAVLAIPVAALTAFASALGSQGGEPQGERQATSNDTRSVQKTPSDSIGSGKQHAPAGPIALTPEQCAGASQLLKLQTPAIGRVGAPPPSVELAAQVANSSAWAAAGCPPHAVLGFYPDASGSGQVRLFETPPSGTFPVMSFRAN